MRVPDWIFGGSNTVLDVTSMKAPPFVRLSDCGLRWARRLRRRLRGLPAEESSWWPKILELSRPYSSIELK